MSSAIVKANFRLGQAAELGPALIGSGIVAGSFLPAAAGGIGGASAMMGGFIMGSFASQLSGAGFLQISALGALSAFYGTANFAVNVSGYKFIPFAFLDYSGDGGSNQIGYALSATHALASLDSIIVVAPKKYAVSGPVTSASNVSVHFMWAGWIVSAPV